MSEQSAFAKKCSALQASGSPKTLVDSSNWTRPTLQRTLRLTSGTKTLSWIFLWRQLQRSKTGFSSILSVILSLSERQHHQWSRISRSVDWISSRLMTMSVGPVQESLQSTLAWTLATHGAILVRTLRDSFREVSLKSMPHTMQPVLQEILLKKLRLMIKRLNRKTRQKKKKLQLKSKRSALGLNRSKLLSRARIYP